MNVGIPKHDPWTDSEIETVRRLSADGFSAARIAERLGAPRTRNAVIGIMHRRGIVGGAPARAVIAKPRRAAPRLAPPPAPPVAPVTQPVSLMDIGVRQCRWLVGDALACCGAPAPLARPYCEFHAGLSYQSAHRRLPSTTYAPRRPL